MKWTILLDPDFETWLSEQEQGVQVAIAAHANLLSQRGPSLGRPYVDTLQGSQFTNLKELRVQYRGAPWRVLFAFDPKRQAILLVGGCKQGQSRWYREMIPIAEQRYQRHLDTME
ncbi:type II toxin-antitoxin system RelE/ParE family toxin [Candidatus Viridilinea mediisalina]|uniref:Addiction module toxin RelE n=1 Tax=Candidatus Viridilinea mediisalina TaxID=2024553 RepID=A0A2A6RH66_9CHLR|nr:type II toxin-antitoxin system RelE/ParE family toxin [Candidatus Viridilinea mediisalina]PDW02228.1 addiction module toxin RelE [Candidatus Viridilinea mediisalina]